MQTNESKSNNCSLTFDKYIVDYVEFKKNENYIPNGKVEIELGMSHNFDKIDDKTARVSLLIQVFDDSEKNNKPFEMKLAISGIFKISEINKINKKILEQNTLAILFPYARALISTYTANSGVPALILPPINIIEYLENEEQK